MRQGRAADAAAQRAHSARDGVRRSCTKLQLPFVPFFSPHLVGQDPVLVPGELLRRVVPGGRLVRELCGRMAQACMGSRAVVRLARRRAAAHHAVRRATRCGTPPALPKPPSPGSSCPCSRPPAARASGSLKTPLEQRAGRRRRQSRPPPPRRPCEGGAGQEMNAVEAAAASRQQAGSTGLTMRAPARGARDGRPRGARGRGHACRHALHGPAGALGAAAGHLLDLQGRGGGTDRGACTRAGLNGGHSERCLSSSIEKSS